jgi:hypothetical protein
MSQVTLQGNASGTGIFTIAAPNSNTNRTLNLPDAAGDVVLTTATQTLTNKSISGAQINSGTVAVARLGSGTPGTGNFLRGDGSWQTVPTGAPTTAQVLSATAGAALGAVGTYAWLVEASNNTTNVTAGSTFSGSSFRFYGFCNDGFFGQGVQALPLGGTPAGTWRAMGTANKASTSFTGSTLFLRIS